MSDILNSEELHSRKGEYYENEFFKNPMHPYSVALLNSLPANNFNNTELKTIEGQPPNIQQTINGCKFNPRCKKIINNLCNVKQPQLQEVSKKHYVECFLHNK